MKTSIKAKLIAVLATLVAVMCMLTVMTGFSVAKASEEITDVSQISIDLEKTASIKTQGNQGIRFTAKVSEGEYGFLAANYQFVKYGVLICPIDYIDDANDLKVGGWTIKVDEQDVSVIEYTGEKVEGAKYFQNAQVNPVLKNGEYIYRGSFVNINENNYARDFSVRAYVAYGENENSLEYIYSDISSRSVYTVATHAKAKGYFDDEDESVQNYFDTIIGQVNAKYGRDDYSIYLTDVNGNVLTSVKEGDIVKILGTAKNATAGAVEAKPILAYSSGIFTDNGDGTYTIGQKGDFAIGGTVYGKVATEFDDEGNATKYENKNLSKYIRIDNEEIVVNEYESTALTDLIENGYLTVQARTNTSTATYTSTIEKITENIPGDLNSTEVYKFYGSHGSAQKLYFDEDNKIDLGYKYLTFKYYYDGTSFSMRERSFYVTNASKGVIEPGTPSGFYGLWAIRQYDANGNFIDSAAKYAKCLNTWITAEIKIDIRPTNNNIDFWPDSADKTVYFADFNVANYSIADKYSEFEIKVEGATGENGAAKPGDLLTITTWAKALGATEKTEISATLAYDTNALSSQGLNTYLYLGSGDFTLTATYWGATVSLDVSGIEGVIPSANAMAPLSTVGNFTIVEMKDMSETGVLNTEGKTIYKATSAGGGYANRFILVNSSDSAYANKFITFKVYYEGQLSGGWISLNDVDVEVISHAASDAGFGYMTANIYDEKGNKLSLPTGQYSAREQLDKNNKFTWLTVELDITTIGTRGIRLHFDGAATIYFADFTVSNYSLCTERYSNLALSVGGGTGENGAFEFGDEVIISATVNELGKDTPTSLSLAQLSSLTITEGAVVLTGGKYIYQGTGNFDITATYWGLTQTVNCTGNIKKESKILLPTAVANKLAVNNITASDLPEGISVDGLTYTNLYSVERIASVNAYFSGSNADFANKYLSFKFYLDETDYNAGRRLAVMDADAELGTYSRNAGGYYGNWTWKTYAQDGTEITSKTEYEAHFGEWLTVEIAIQSTGSMGVKIHFDGNGTYYFADFMLTNYSVMAK